ncbi:MAG: NAD(P)-dependent oxidoreductase [Erysipelotrichaceae bacterium]|nr:NAD(P)-dependent oxidoreductase [Erysipelotrichaceae bacterium]
MKVGFIGTGVMGQSLVRHLMAAGYQVYIYNRTKTKALPLIAEKAIWCDTIKDLAMQCDVIMTMVGYPNDVKDVYFNVDHGILNYAQAGSLLIDLTTSTPSLAKEIAQYGKQRKLDVIDAPVSGGDSGAKNATLTIMCGGTKAAYQRALPFLNCFGKNIVLQGEAGSGQHTKMCNQIAIAANMIGVCEAISYARKANLEPSLVLDSIAYGAAASWQLTNNGQKILANDDTPGFYIKHFIKDMKIALDEAKAMNLELPGLKLVESLYEELAQAGYNDLGTQALIAWYQKQG